MKIIVWVIGLAFTACTYCCVPAFSDSLPDWLDSIDEVNPSVVAARAKWKAAEAMVNQAAGWDDPMLGVEVMRDNTQFSDYMNLAYMVEQAVPWPGRLRMVRGVAQLEAEAIGYEMLEVRRQVRAKITAATWALWAARKSAEVVKENVELTSQLTEVTRARLEAAQAPQTDWLRMQVELEKIRNEAVTMEREIDVAQARLNALLNAPPGTFRATDEMPPLPELIGTIPQLQDDARQYNGIRMATLWREKARDLARKSTRLEQRPNFAFRVEARQFRETGSIDEFDTGVLINFPWLWRGKYKARNAEAEADLAMVRAELDEETAMTLTDIQEMYTEAEARLRSVKLYETSILPQTRALADSSREAYPAGSMSAMELLDAQRMVQDALMTYYRESAAYVAAHAKLFVIAQPWTPDEVDTGLPLHQKD
jgi:outer membrane protein TolC